MKQYKRERPNNFREVLIAILIGAGVSFFTVLFQGLAEFLSQNGDQIAASLLSMGYYLAKNYRV